ADLASRADDAPEGRSIVALARRFGAPEETEGGEWTFVPFTAETRMSGVDRGTESIRKGAGDSVAMWSGTNSVPPEVNSQVEVIARSGGTPLLVAENHVVFGTI